MREVEIYNLKNETMKKFFPEVFYTLMQRNKVRNIIIYTREQHYTVIMLLDLYVNSRAFCIILVITEHLCHSNGVFDK